MRLSVPNTLPSCIGMFVRLSVPRLTVQIDYCEMPGVYSRSMMEGIAVNNTTIFVIHNIVSTTRFGHFLTSHHQVGIQYQRNYIPTIIQSLVSVSTKKGG